ncbi:hypothetical protein D3C74_105870 [compost metagenome]
MKQSSMTLTCCISEIMLCPSSLTKSCYIVVYLQATGANRQDGFFCCARTDYGRLGCSYIDRRDIDRTDIA